jgi:hypothetical protein
VAARYFCRDEGRREAVREKSGWNGIDFVEVDADQRTLSVHFLKTPLPAGIDRSWVRIEGGVRIRGIRVETAVAGGEVLTVTVDRPGDFSLYTLRLVAPPPPAPTAAPTGKRKGKARKAEPAAAPVIALDPRLSAVDFSFKVDCPTPFDCKAETDCPPPTFPEPEIDYLAKDYASFRRLMLDRMASIAPDWRERSPADLGVALVELLAYVGDQLSYYQDAVATEAYLGTALQRVSVRRHARLLDYFLGEGVAARAWVEVEAAAGAAGVELPAGTPVLTRFRGDGAVLSNEELALAAAAGATVFETLHPVALHESHNTLRFYTWSDLECCLPVGATAATLISPAEELRIGQPLLFEEARGPLTGESADADPAHRHVVRLTQVQDKAGEEDGAPPLEDPVTGTKVVEIEWDSADALPFPLCLSSRRDGLPDGELFEQVSVARGNLMLADHGMRIGETDLGLDPTVTGFALRLRYGPLTHAAPLPDGFERQPAASLRPVSPAAGRPAVRLRDGAKDDWEPRRDLLASGRFDRHFVAEVDERGRPRLRFGDDENGLAPDRQARFAATYRVGQGAAGNLGAEGLAQAVIDPDRMPEAGAADRASHAAGLSLAITGVRNPLPAWGGVEPESLEEVRQYAPQAFRVQQRAVTAADYAEVAGRHPEVQKALATFRWTGSWTTVFVTVDRRGGGEVDAAFERRLRDHLEPFRMAGYDLEIDGPRRVPIELDLFVCVEPGHFPGDVERALAERLGSRTGRDGRPGFFHPDLWTFGQPVYLSRIYAAAMEVEGVASVEARIFQRWDRPSRDGLASGVLGFGRLEIAQLDNDPSFPENGRLALRMGGGR